MVRKRRRSPADRGAAAVEFTFLFVFLFMPICYGTLSAGIVFSDKLDLSQSAREGARYGATQMYSPATRDAFLLTTRASAKGSEYAQIGPGSPSYCVAFRQADGTNWHMAATDTTAQAGPCSGYTAAPVKSVLVAVTKPGTFDFVFDKMTFTISSVSVARYEGTP